MASPVRDVEAVFLWFLLNNQQWLQWVGTGWNSVPGPWNFAFTVPGPDRNPSLESVVVWLRGPPTIYNSWAPKITLWPLIIKYNVDSTFKLLFNKGKNHNEIKCKLNEKFTHKSLSKVGQEFKDGNLQDDCAMSNLWWQVVTKVDLENST
jgi:hypothetical protein